MKNTWWKSGEWNALCDVCGRKYKSTELKLRWDGLMVCNGDWELRHPQDLIRGLPAEKAPAWTRPEGENQFITVNYIVGPGCTPTGELAIAGIGVAGCMIAGRS